MTDSLHLLTRAWTESAPIILDLTTSTGDPIQTAKNPAPRPEARWQGTVSENSPVPINVCLICTHAACHKRIRLFVQRHLLAANLTVHFSVHICGESGVDCKPGQKEKLLNCW